MTKKFMLAIVFTLSLVCGPAFCDEGGVIIVTGPYCSPDGSKIVFATNAFDNDEINDIWTVNLNGSQLTRLTSTSDFNESDPIYSPNGALIAYSRSADNEDSVWVINADGSNARRVSREGKSASAPTWLNDNQRLIIQTPRTHSADLLLTNLSQEETKMLAVSSDHEDNPHCSSDGNLMVYEREPSSCSVCRSTGAVCSQIWKRNIVTLEAAVQLTTGHYEDELPSIGV